MHRRRLVGVIGGGALAVLAAGLGPGGGTLPAAAQTGGLEGLYSVTKVNYLAKPLTMYQDHYLFTRDGRVYNGVPRDGEVERFDFARAEREEPNKCGTYQLQGGKIRFQFPAALVASFKDYEETFEDLGNGRIKLRGSRGFRVKPLPNGHRIDGSYARLTSGATFSSKSQVEVAGAQRLTLRPDGTYDARNVGLATAGGAGAATDASASGTYLIRGTTLQLTDGSGRTEKLLFYVDPDEAEKRQPSWIAVRGMQFRVPPQ